MKVDAQPNDIADGYVIKFLRSIDLFKDIDKKTIDLFLKNAKTKHQTKGNILFLREDPADYFFIIVSGWVKLFRETINGDESIVNISTAGSLLGADTILEDGSYQYSAQVVEDVELIIIPTKILKDEVENNKKLALNMLALVNKCNTEQSKEIEHLNIQNAPQRIGCFLLQLCTKNQMTEQASLKLPYDKVLISSKLGMKPETFSRAIATLKEKTGIQIDGADVTIKSIKKLSDYCCSSCSDSFPCNE